MSGNNIHPLFKVAEVELIYRSTTPADERIKISSAYVASNILRNAWDENRIELVEEFKILMVDRRHACLGIATISIGGITECPVDTRIIYATALKARATGIILAHNHPSSNPQPSQADIQLTKKIYEGGKILNIDVLDHFILTTNDYYSFMDNGMMPT